jgi:hypothetical protein
MAQAKLEVRVITGRHAFSGAPSWGVYSGKMLVARFATEPEAEACRVRLQHKIDRGAVLDVVARVRNAIES